MKTFLPPLRALQAFEAFGRLGSVSGAAQELGVTAGAVSQQLKVLEAHLGIQMVLKDGRRAKGPGPVAAKVGRRSESVRSADSAPEMAHAAASQVSVDRCGGADPA